MTTAPARRPAGHRARHGGGGLEIHPLTPGRWSDFERLFGPRGACAGCWCMFPRLRSAEWKTQGATNRRAMKRIVEAGDPPGLLAYEGGEPVAWIAVAPRETYRRFERSRVAKPVDDRPVWSVPCFFVARAARGRGLTVRLLEAACDYVAARGGRIVEGYPVDPKSRPYAPTFAWHGLASAFLAAGFAEVARRSPARPIMRRELGRRAAQRG